MLDSSLRQIIRAGKINHAWLLTGEQGALLPQAKALAKALLCQAATDGEACGQCVSCQQFAEGNHPDFQLIQPEGLSVKIHQTRKMQHFANLQSYEGGRQVIIIDQAWSMQGVAANSLLKILEEPPVGVYFILTAPMADMLLPTILSRTTVVRVEGEAEADPDPHLTEQMAKQAAKAIKLLAGDTASLLLLAASFKDDKKSNVSARKQITCFLHQLLQVLRDIAVSPLGEQTLGSLPPQTLPPTAALQGAVLVEEYIDLLNRNINSMLLLSVLLLKLKELADKSNH